MCVGKMDHRTFTMSAIRGNDQVVACPYNPSHQILKSRLQTHLVKCARQHKEKEMATCAFNSTHRVPRPEIAAHLQECPDRKTLEGHKFTLADEAVGTCIPNAPSVITAQLPACEENWDEEVLNSTYNPSEYVRQMKVLRTLTGATKAERKKFRLEERRRVTQLEAAEAAAANASPTTNFLETHSLESSPTSPAEVDGEGRSLLRRPHYVPDNITQSLYSKRLGMGRGMPPPS